MIGLVDYDLYKQMTGPPSKTRVLQPNLEIAKLSTYYLTEKNQACKLLQPDAPDEEIAACETIYFLGEKYCPDTMLDSFLKHDDLHVGGAAFNEGEYLPIGDEIIDYTLPNLYLYKSVLHDAYNLGMKAKTITDFLDNCYYRMKVGDKFLPTPPICSRKKVFLYDKNIFADGCMEIIQRIAAYKPSQIVPLHPIICHKVREYEFIRTKTQIGRTANIILDLNIPLDETNVLMKKYSRLFLADMALGSKVFLPLGGSQETSDKYYRNLIYILNLTYAFWAKKIPIKILFIPPRLGYTNPISNFSRFLQNQSRDYVQDAKTIDQRIFTPQHTKCTLKNERELIVQFDESARRLFNQTFYTISERGYQRV